MAAPAMRRAAASNVLPPALASVLVQRLDVARVSPLSQTDKDERAVATEMEPSTANSQRREQGRPKKTFSLHIGASLALPTDNALWTPPREDAPEQQSRAAGKLYDPFEGLPLRGLAERFGTVMEPMAAAMREDARRRKTTTTAAGAADVELTVPVPSGLPITRWVAGNQTVRDTLVAQHPKDLKKARLSWYHPDDTMVPRDWFRGGLLADLSYYNPFGMGAWSSTAKTA